MANNLDRQILLDGHRNCVVRFTGLIDTADVSETPALRLTDLVNNAPRMTLYGLRVDHVGWSVSDGMELVLEWNSTDPQLIHALSGQSELCTGKYGGLIPDKTLPGFDGAINLRTKDFAPGTTAAYAVVLKLIKLYS